MPRFSLLKLWQFLLGTAIVGVLCILPGRAERLPIKTYTVADGLLRDSADCIRQDSRGFLWFCTVEGVSRFDGYAFTNFTTDDGLPDRHINSLLEARNGSILIATDNGIAKLNPIGTNRSSFQNPKSKIQNQDNPLFTVFQPNDPKAKNIRVLFEDTDGHVWVGTTDGLYRLNGKDGQIEFAAVFLGESQISNNLLYITAITQDERGNLWIGTGGSGLFRLSPPGDAEHFTKKNGLPDLYVASLLTDRAGRVWVGLSGTGGLALLRSEPDTNSSIVERALTIKDGLPTGWIPSLFQASNGQMWVGTTGGLCKWQGENKADSVCEVYQAKNDLCDTEIWSINEDKDNNLWFGTRCGTKKLSRYGFTSFTQTDGFNFLSVNSIFENSAGEFFISSNYFGGRRVSRFDDDKFVTAKPRLPANVKYMGWGWKQTI